MDSKTAIRSGNATLESGCSTCCRSLALFAFVLLTGSFSLANAQGWDGSGPFPPNANSRTVHAVVIDPVTGTVYAGTGSGTVFSLSDETLSRPPEAFDDSAVTKPGIAIGIDVLTNDVDPEGALEVNSVALQAVPADGTATANSDGSVTYTPGVGFVGADSFTYTVRDAAGNTSNVATVTVRINAPPTAAGDTADILQNEPVTIDVLANDADSDGSLDPATVVVADPPTNGSAIEESDGRITYAPAVDFTGVDTFSYRVGDNDGGVSNVAAVTVTVSAKEPPNTPPVANDDVAAVLEGQSVTVLVLANDNDTDGTLVPATVALQGAPGNGSAHTDTGGSIVYTPAAGFSGTDSFTYAVDDDDGATSNTATVTITVTAAGGDNAAPVAANDAASTEEGVPVDIDVLANDSDADGTLDAANVTLQGEPADGTAEVNAGGTVTYTPDAGFTGTDSFTYTVQDDAGASSDPATVTVTVTAADVPPSPPSGGGGSGGSSGGGGGGAAGLLWLGAMVLALLHRAMRAPRTIGHVSLFAMSALAAGAAWAEPLLYVTHETAGTVSVIDTATGGLVRTMTVPGSYRDAPAVSPDGRRLFLVAGGAVSVADTGMFDSAMSSIIGSIDVGAGSAAIAVAPNGSRAYVTNTNDDTVAVVDLGTNTVVDSITVESFPNAIALTPDGMRAYVANGQSGSVSVIDLATLDVDSIAVGSGLQHIVMSPDGTRAYVTSSVTDNVSVIDTAAELVVSTIGDTDAFPTGVFGIALTPDGSRIYVTQPFDNLVSVIDIATESVIDTISVGRFPWGIGVTPDGSHAYVANSDDDTISLIDTATNTVIGAPISVATRPAGITIGPAPAVTAVVTDPADPLALYAGTAGAGMYRSADGGESWASINGGLADLDITALAIASNGSAVYAGTRSSGVFRSMDKWASWEPASAGLDLDVFSLHILPGNDQVLFAGTDGGVYKTTDGGTTWEAIDAGLP